MQTVPLHISWTEIALRLALTVVAGALLGIDRTRNEHPAGLRTSLLVTLAASIAMIQMNLLLATDGKTSSSFSVLDLMRLPLGILTGVGFIGAGAILKRDETVIGVTTAATMWFATIIGLCMGGGQLALGSVSTVGGCLVLWALKRVEHRLYRTQRALIVLKSRLGSMTEATLRSVLDAAQIEVKTIGVHFKKEPDAVECFDVAARWRPAATAGRVPTTIQELSARDGVIELSWKPAGAPADE